MAFKRKAHRLQEMQYRYEGLGFMVLGSGSFMFLIAMFEMTVGFLQIAPGKLFSGLDSCGSELCRLVSLRSASVSVLLQPV